MTQIVFKTSREILNIKKGMSSTKEGEEKKNKISNKCFKTFKSDNVYNCTFYLLVLKKKKKMVCT